VKQLDLFDAFECERQKRIDARTRAEDEARLALRRSLMGPGNVVGRIECGRHGCRAIEIHEQSPRSPSRGGGS